ncbi:MAG: STAS domain-containing protein [SAR324 cluster bacterium]|nr:STAS domain-containing protein [SAR324 cluster bacterium]
MKLSHRILGKICIIDIEGEITGSAARNQRFSSYIKQQIEEEIFRAIVLDFRNVELIDSVGMGIIRLFHKIAKEQKTGFALYHLNQAVRSTLDFVGISVIVPVFETEEEVLAAFQTE